MTGDGYVWLLLGWYHSGWYLEEDVSIDCSRDEMKQAVERSYYISTESLHIGASDQPTISGLVSWIY